MVSSKLRGKTPLDETITFPISNDPGGVRVPFIECDEENFRIFPTIVIDPVTGKAELPRSPTVYNNITTLAAGSTAIWTPAAGKRWRLMGVCITLLQGTTAAAGSAVTLMDGTVLTGIGVTLCIGAMAAVPNTVVISAIDMKMGILAAAPGTALNVNLTTVLAAGGVSVQVWGTEE